MGTQGKNSKQRKNQNRKKKNDDGSGKALEELERQSVASAHSENDDDEQEEKHQERIVTMDALDDISVDDGDDGEMPPLDEWPEEAIALKKAIEDGKFDDVVRSYNDRKNQQDGTDDDSSILEEFELDDEDGEDDGNHDEDKELGSEGEPEVEEDNDSVESEKQVEGRPVASSVSDTDIQTDGASAGDRVANDKEEESDVEDDDKEEGNYEEDMEQDKKPDGDGKYVADDDSATDDDSDDDDGGPGSSAKALLVVTNELISSKKRWPWAETFDIIAPTPLPFASSSGASKTNDGASTAPTDEEGEDVVNIHDDLKREVAFYDMALEAVHEARKKCDVAGVPFSRPDDFFAEMVKTDDHMAKVKDRLIFEKKKMDAFAQRKSNKEQKLRSKEANANRLAEKAKRKKDHLKAVEEWAQTAASRRGSGAVDDQDDDRRFLGAMGDANSNKRRRIAADRKYGRGGKRGRFKQNDSKTLNDMSSYNPSGNFSGLGRRRRSSAHANATGTSNSKVKTMNGSGANRKGKRARDASRSRRK